ncbi:MAG TPA: hypothetical protein DDX91_03820 [Ruminococcaceae bacterium]|nr:hypothetical protein [Oscillospiraceae bacterium]
MGFSELELLKEDLGLDWDGDRLCLFGSILGYPVFIADNPKKREYTVTAFYKVRTDTEDALKSNITLLLDAMPKNCVTGRTDERRYTSLRFNAALLYQENSIYLVHFVNELCLLANKLDLVPVTPEEREKEALAPFSTPLPEKEEKPVKRSKKAILKGFDKHSIKGLFGAAVGGGAMTVISAIVTAIGPSDTGAMIAGWAAGALIAVIVLADYWFFAKKIDIFGSIACSLITAICCFAAADTGTLRSLCLAMRRLDPSVTINQTMENWSYYQIFFPEATDRFSLMLVQNYLSAILASVVFFTLYFRKHQGIMFGKSSEVFEEEGGKKKMKPLK